MNKTLKKLIAFCLSLSLAAVFLIPAIAEGTALTESELKFNEDGEFKIVQFSDTQDDALPSKAMLTLIDIVCKEVKPDLIIFTGDNVSQAKPLLNKAAIKQLIEPIAKAGIPYAYTFGNHDAERDVSKETQHGFYMQYGNCLTYNADDSIHGYGNCNIPIMSNDGEDIAFNLWLIDSNMYHENGGYDIVYPDQVEWYKNTSIALEEAAGHKVPSLVFQHIIPPEIFDYLKPAPEGTDKSTKYHNGRDQRYILEFAEDAVLAPNPILQEFPCPPNYNTNEVEVMAERGDVLGITSGHDHINSFVLSMENGIDLIQTPGMSFQSYGNDNVRGFRTYTLNENNPWGYETETFKYTDFMSTSEIYNVPNDIMQFFVSLKVIFEVILESITSFAF